MAGICRSGDCFFVGVQWWTKLAHPGVSRPKTSIVMQGEELAMPGWKTRIRKRASEVLNLPADALLNVPRVTCIGGSQVIVEGADGLIEVGDSCIAVDLGGQTLWVRGQAFEVTLVTEHEIHVTGRVAQIEYQSQGGASL
ncbi:hypothetical protein GCM10025858_06440 [Alicyclobacillus sacchari]|nr:hypothetical protein GCM10025858_06440 [Alicyclobacillus sacchari]